MKFIRDWNNFKEFRLNESIIYDFSTCENAVKPQMTKALNTFPKMDPKEILKWVQTTILGTKSPSFIAMPLIEELKLSGGAGGKFLPKNYHGVTSPLDLPRNDYKDYEYLKFMDMIFRRGYGILADPNDATSANSEAASNEKKKVTPKACGLFYIEQLCEKKFEGNVLPYAIIKYCIKRVRKDVAKQISFVNNAKNRKGVEMQEYVDLFVPKGQQPPPQQKPKEGEEKPSGIPPGCFKDESASNHLPELKQLLIKVGLRDVDDPTKPMGLRIKLYEPILKKKREEFYKYFTTNIYAKIQAVVDAITDEDIEKYLEAAKIDAKSGEQKFSEEDEVVYLKKDKTIKDWNELKEFEKADLENINTAKVVGKGKVISVSEEGEYKIQFGDGKITKKTSKEIVKKIDKPEEEEKEEEKPEEKKEAETSKEGTEEKKTNEKPS